jgi:hypothetical protein
MEEEERLIEKLEKWVEEHPKEADVPHINLTTQKEFTIRGILSQMVEVQKTGLSIVDEEVLGIKDQIAKWIGG